MALAKPVDWQMALPVATLSCGTGPNALGSFHENWLSTCTILGGTSASLRPGVTAHDARMSMKGRVLKRVTLFMEGRLA